MQTMIHFQLNKTPYYRRNGINHPRNRRNGSRNKANGDRNEKQPSPPIKIPKACKKLPIFDEESFVSLPPMSPLPTRFRSDAPKHCDIVSPKPLPKPCLPKNSPASNLPDWIYATVAPPPPLDCMRESPTSVGMKKSSTIRS